jgi:hypothetical protein
MLFKVKKVSFIINYASYVCAFVNIFTLTAAHKDMNSLIAYAIDCSSIFFLCFYNFEVFYLLFVLKTHFFAFFWFQFDLFVVICNDFLFTFYYLFPSN